MEWRAWEPLYREILGDFGFDAAADERARDELDALLETKLRAELPDLRGQRAVILGPARAAATLPEGPLFVADPREVPPRRPDAIVTDLDGDVALQVMLNAMDVPLFVHAHGDNIAALREHVPHFRGPVRGTCQAAPKGRVLNLGGFTDGDRACCLAVAAGATSLVLAGFDFDRAVDKPGRAAETKLRKLAWARRIIGSLGVPVTFASR